MEENIQVQHLLKIYEEASGQKINKEKTSLLFGKNTSNVDQDRNKATWGVEAIKQHEKYLGLPSLVGQSKKRSFLEIKERV